MSPRRQRKIAAVARAVAAGTCYLVLAYIFTAAAFFLHVCENAPYGRDALAPPAICAGDDAIVVAALAWTVVVTAFTYRMVAVGTTARAKLAVAGITLLFLSPGIVFSP